MAKLYITEYAKMANVGTQYAECGEEPAIAQQVIEISSVSVQSATFNAKTQFVRLVSDVDMAVEFGSSPTATTSSKRVAKDSAEFFGVKGLLPDALLKVAAISLEQVLAFPTNAAVSNTSGLIVAANANRTGLVIVNVGSANISLAFGTSAVANSGVTLAPNGVYEMDDFIFTTLAVNAISPTSSTAAIQEYS